MANQLAMDKALAIQGLASTGMSERQISAALSISRKAVRRHLGRGAAKDTKAPTGSEPVGVGPSGGTRSLCRAFQEVIIGKLEQGLTAQRIHQDLCVEHGFIGKYSSVRRFVSELSAGREPAFRRMEVAPGHELQVDYGTGARCRDAAGKLGRTHVFRVVLSHSRKGYSEAVRRLTTESFIRSLENAFRALGGVPRTIVFDNAKAVVSQADWHDPELNPKIVEFCRHYGCTLLPTRPRTPRHKGKIERGVGYMKSNGLRGREFSSLAEQNAHLREWERNVADTRIHGTTKQHVGRLFETVERGALGPLPAEPFPWYEEGRRRVSRDGHIEVQRSFYSAPPEFLGRDVWVRWNDQTVRILNDRCEQVCLHCRQQPGRFSTHDEHLAPEKISGVERGAAYLLGKVRIVGPHALRWAEATLEQRGVQGLRTIQGLLGLSRKYTAAELERACDAAWRSGDLRYRIVKAVLKRQSAVQETMEFIDAHPVIRPMAEYGEFIRNAIQGG